MPRKRKLDIKVVFDAKLYAEHGMVGSCLADDSPRNNLHKMFTIHIDPALDFMQTLAILAHELTHVKQYATPEMSYDYRNSDNTIWYGKTYGPDEFTYEDAPWEIDASIQESVLQHELITTTELWK